MADQSERINTPISTRELERRWAAVRAAMAAERIDVLVMQNNNDYMGGYVKYFTDLPAANGYPVTVIFPKDDLMTVISQGPFGMDRPLHGESDGLRRGVGRIMTTPSYASAPYTRHYDAELSEKALEPFARGAIGLVGTASLPSAFVDYLKRGKLAQARFVEASDLVDKIKMIKSPEEITLIRRTAALQDRAMEAAMAAVQPGKREIEIVAEAERLGRACGSEQGIFMTSSAPLGAGIMNSHRHTQNRILRDGDHFALLIETNGPGGFYTEIGRTCVLGKASQKMRDEFAFVLEARRFTLNLLKPGAACKQIWESYNTFLRKNGRPEEQRLYCHGQGYDMVERPLVRFDEPFPIERNINLALHPTYLTPELQNWICDNYLLDDTGALERLHHFPEKIIELA